MSDIDPEKMKVVELRSALAEHGLDTKGNKAVLVARLKEFLESQGGDSGGAESEAPAAAEPAAEEPMEAEPTPAPAETPAAKSPEKPAEAPVAAAKTPEKPAETKTEEAKTPGEETKAEGENANKDKTPGNKRGQKRKRGDDEPFEVREDEPEIANDFMCLDWQNSDLTLKINKETFVAAEPFYSQAWGYIFSSARATHGFKAGKIAFSVKWTGNMEVKLDEVKEPHELRVGFSTNDCNLQAGESPLSFCCTNTGKKASNTKFEDYENCTFTTDDVVTAMIDFAGNQVQISFMKNGDALGNAFTFPKSQLSGKFLFPHVSSRNVKFEVNFGKDKDGNAVEPSFPLPAGFKMAADCLNNASRGAARIEKRDQCEMIMLIGLPGCGKSTWVEKHVSENPDKRYNIIGASALIERMKVNGEARKGHVTNWEQLIGKLTKCAQDMIRLASQRRRNIIIDQTNVFMNAQKRKSRPFEGMIRKAIVIVPSDEDYKARIEAQEKADSKEVPDNGVMEMKANFSLPDMGEEKIFTEVIFPDLAKEEAAKLVEEYNKDAKEKGFGKKQENNRKRGRMNHRGGMRGMMRGRMFRGRGGPMGRGGHRGFFQRGRPFPPRGFMRGGPPMRGGPMGPPRGMHPMRGPMGMGMPNRGMPMRGGRGGPQNRGGQGGRGGHQGGQKPAPWGQNPWQQNQQRQGGWGGAPQGGQWGQGPQQNPWNRGGQQGGWQNGGGFGNNQGYPGSQNWGGFR